MHYDPSDLWSRIIDPDPDPSKMCGLIRGCTFCIGNVVPSCAYAFCNPKLLSIRLLFDQLKIKWQKLQMFFLSRCLYVQAFVAIRSFREGLYANPSKTFLPDSYEYFRSQFYLKRTAICAKEGIVGPNLFTWWLPGDCLSMCRRSDHAVLTRV